MTRPKKLDNLLEAIREHLDTDQFRFTVHAEQRCVQRKVNDLEVEYVLRNGWHEKRKDKYDEAYQAWNYAVRGETMDEDRDLRVIVSFDGDMLIITVIDTTK
ncbi:MAG: DUF4258 domain-containing protein [Persicimonas sp.]